MCATTLSCGVCQKGNHSGRIRGLHCARSRGDTSIEELIDICRDQKIPFPRPQVGSMTASLVRSCSLQQSSKLGNAKAATTKPAAQGNIRVRGNIIGHARNTMYVISVMHGYKWPINCTRTRTRIWFNSYKSRLCVLYYIYLVQLS